MDKISSQVEKECSSCNCNPYLKEENNQCDSVCYMQDESTLLNQFDQQSKALCGRIEKSLDSSPETANVVKSVQESAAQLASIVAKSSDEDVMEAGKKALKLWGELRELQVSGAISQTLLSLGDKLLQIHRAALDRIISRSFPVE